MLAARPGPGCNRHERERRSSDFAVDDDAALVGTQQCGPARLRHAKAHQARLLRPAERGEERLLRLESGASRRASGRSHYPSVARCVLDDHHVEVAVRVGAAQHVVDVEPGYGNGRECGERER